MNLFLCIVFLVQIYFRIDYTLNIVFLDDSLYKFFSLRPNEARDFIPIAMLLELGLEVILLNLIHFCGFLLRHALARSHAASFVGAFAPKVIIL